MQILRKAAAASICAALAMTAVPSFAADTSDGVSISFVVGSDKITINGTETDMVPAYIVEGTTLVPLRVITEGLGADVDWDGETRTVTVVNNGTTIKLVIGSTTVTVDGSESALLAAPEIKEDRTMVPIRFISETIGAKVDWDGDTSTVTITKEAEMADLFSMIDNTKWSYSADDNVYWQTGIRYCADPVDTDYETMGVYVPGEYMNAKDNGDGTYTCALNKTAQVNGYTAETAPIVIPVETPGYSAMKAPTGYSSSVKIYTAAGFIYANPGCRGRDHGAPLGITDLKAAVRYIRANGDSMPGSTDRIFTFGMSGGGAQSALMGVTGDSELYDPYLEAIGAVMDQSDSVFGSMCWCPITNLDYADAAYEWNMGMTRSDLSDDMQALSDGLANAFAKHQNTLGLKDKNGNVLSLDESDEGIYMAGTYYDYLVSVVERSLNNFLEDTTFPYTKPASKGFGGGMGGNFGGGMHEGGFGGMGTQKPDGEMPAGEAPAGGDVSYEAIDGISRTTTAATADEDTTYETVQDYIDSLNKDFTWINYDANTNTASITSLTAFVKACKNASKSIGAFDDLNTSQGENTLFGYGDGKGAHFDSVMAELLKGTEYEDAYAADLSKKDALGNKVDVRLNMYNPLYYLNSSYEGCGKSTPAKNWRIRTGINQGDTALTTEVNLSLALENAGYDVDFETIWGQGHTKAERTGDSDSNFIEWVNECLK